MPEPSGSPATVPSREHTPTGGGELTAEDAKLVVLARGARGRIGAVEGAAVRDQDGRTYAAASVSLPSLTVTALQLAVASAVAAGATRLEAGAVVTEASTLDGAGHAAVRDLAADAPIHVAAPDGTLLGTVLE
ncbi:cytidine deaminase [Plantactinospora sp. WMMC1484]|uniref:cytidine deaminase n=1 Tax=Plantactinospora sp. WMMC1484 TaxID=3404122 RepID=UPI003BF4EE33